MFDSVLQRGTIPKRRFGTGAVVSVVIHVGVIAFALWASARGTSEEDLERQKVTFVKPPPPPPPPPAPKEQPKKVEKQKMVLQQAIVAPTEIPTLKPAEQDPVTDDKYSGSYDMGEVANVAGGIQGSVIDARDAVKPVEFNESMTRPEYLSGPQPEYTQKALEREVQGQMIVKCIVTAEGRVEDCRVVQSLPFMDRAVITALEKRRYKPATFQGRPITVDYTFNLTLTLPQ